MSKRKTYTFEPLLSRVEVFSVHGPDGDHGGEDTRGADGQPVYPGVGVRVRPHFNDRLGISIPDRFGSVIRLFRQEGLTRPESGCDIVVEARGRGARFFWLDEVRRSVRQTEEMKADNAAYAAAVKADVIAAEGV